jgi:hypothetical protein
MSLVLGPILLFVFVAGIAVSYLATRWVIQLLTPQVPGYDREAVPCGSCRYDLRGTLAAGGSECPECGAKLRLK